MKKKSLRKLQLSKKQIAKMNPAKISGGWGSYSSCYPGLQNGDEAPLEGYWGWNCYF